MASKSSLPSVFVGWWSRWLSPVVDFVFPVRSVLSGATGAYLSPEEKRLIVPHPDMCPVCHRPSHDFVVCARCDAPYRGIHIAFDYSAGIKKLIQVFKYRRVSDVSDYLTQRLVLSMQTNHHLMEFIQSGQVLVMGVPSHRYKKIFQRWFNQSEILAQKVAQALALEYGQPLVKIRYTTPQMKLPRAERLLNVKGSFGLKKDTDLRNYKGILVVDDVVTTNATIKEVTWVIQSAAPGLPVRWVVVARHAS